MRKIGRVLSVLLVICIVLAYLPFNFLNDVKTVASSIVVTIDPGHGGNDSGTVGAIEFGGHYESWYNLEISKAVKERLMQYGVTVYMTRESDIPMTLSSRVDVAVENKSDLLVSIHNNYSGNASVNGTEICGPNKSYNFDMYKVSKEIGENVIKQITESTDLNDRGYSTRDYDGAKYSDGSVADYYAINRYAKQRGLGASFIVECGFCSSQKDVSVLENDESRKQIGDSIADGIAEYYKLTLPEDKENSTETKTPAPTVYNAVAYANGIGGKVGFDLDCAITELNSLKEGTDVYFRVTPDKDYRVTSIFVGDDKVDVSDDGLKTAVYKFVMPAADVKVTASFEKAEYLPGVYKINISSLNVRSLPNANDGTEVFGAVTEGDLVTATEIHNTHWGKIEFEGKIGYVSIHKKYATRIGDIPKETVKPSATATPTQKPTSTPTLTPTPTQKPQVTQTPQVSVKPTVTVRPQITEAPVVTQKPQTTEKPVSFVTVDKLSMGKLNGKNTVYIHENTVVSEAVSDIVKNYEVSDTVVKNVFGDEASAYDTLMTGMKLSFDGNEYDIVVYGDINGDGIVNILDAYGAMQHVFGTKKLTGAYAEACISQSSTADSITIIDVMNILNIIVE